MDEKKTHNGRSVARPRVIVVGAGIAGLFLALLLDKAEIDFVVLEARSEIALQEGAGVVCNGNGMRIFDQLGVADEIINQGSGTLVDACYHSPDGTVYFPNKGFSALLEKMNGYPMVILDRQHLLRIVYGRNSKQSNIITGARVASVDEFEDGVEVTTTDGRRFTGDILVGADGAHSMVRQEMWRLGREREPGYFTDNGIDQIKCNWITLFGISTYPDAIPVNSANVTFNNGTSIDTMRAANDKIYFFLTKRLPKELTGKEIPRFTKDDHDKFAKEHWNDPVRGDVKFRDLYTNVIRTTLVPLQQYVLPKSHFRRILVIGDAAHKLHYATGQGAMTAIEDGAVFINLLTRELKSSPSAHLSAPQVRKILSKMQELRIERTKSLMKESFVTQGLHSWANPLYKCAALYVLPNLGFDFMLSRLIGAQIQAPHLEGYEIPYREKLVGFDDEHPEPQSNLRSAVKIQAYAILALYAVSSLNNSQLLGIELGVASTGANTVQETSMLVIMLVEGWRRTNKLSPLQWPFIWALLGDYVGLRRVAPWFYLVNFWTSSGQGRLLYVLPRRLMVLSAAKAIFPAVSLLYLLPALLGSYTDLSTLAPTFANTLRLPPASCAVLATLAFSFISTDTDTFFGTKYTRYLRIGYAGVFGVLALAHVFALSSLTSYQLLQASSLSAYVPDIVWLTAVVSETCHYHKLQHQLILYMALVLLGFLVVGPGATTIAVWYWREFISS
ncbi:FAD/NAD(P)-binding domain-containing protein [Whalleya microplaca]|nr:FAD/NAD(P)-binding domain-containing protein [Whalleya microplaca]